MKKNLWFITMAFILLIAACNSPQDQEGAKGDKHIVAHPQYATGDLIAVLGWDKEEELTLEIDDPANGEGIDFTDTRMAELIGEGEAVANFELGSQWDLQAGHHITISDGSKTITHTVRDISMKSADVESDVVTGTAQPGTEVMVWIEAPYQHELRVTADSNGEWRADFSGVTDIIPASIGAVAQNDVPPNGSSHTRVNFTFGELHLETSLNRGVIGFNNFTPFNKVGFQIFDSKGGSLEFEGTLETNEIGYITFENEDHTVDLQPGTYIVAVDLASMRSLESELETLRIDSVDMNTATISGTAAGEKPVYLNIYDRANEAEYSQQATADPDGDWQMQFELELSRDMDIVAHISDTSGNEIAFHWIWE